jgi:hypothetical protein
MSGKNPDRGIRRAVRFSALTLVASGLASTAGGAPGAGPLDAVELFFEALNSNDAALAATVMLDDGLLYRYAENAAGLSLAPTPIADYLENLARGQNSLLERIWDVEVLQEGRLAVVWTPYDFYLDEKFHHCGVNSFNLILDDDGWKIASVVYSVHTDTCEPSPLGPPVFGETRRMDPE